MCCGDNHVGLLHAYSFYYCFDVRNKFLTSRVSDVIDQRLLLRLMASCKRFIFKLVLKCCSKRLIMIKQQDNSKRTIARNMIDHCVSNVIMPLKYNLLHFFDLPFVIFRLHKRICAFATLILM